jgi:hypothetical protein
MHHPSLPGASSTKRRWDDATTLRSTLTNLGDKPMLSMIFFARAGFNVGGDINAAVVLDIDFRAVSATIFWMTLPPCR